MYLPRGPFGQRVLWEPRKEDSLWRPGVPSEFTWATGSGENSWWMERGRMAKGLCPGIGRFFGKESVEKRGREREGETSIPRVTWKTNKALTQDSYHSRRHRASSRGDLESPDGKVSSAGFHTPKSWLWRTRRNLNLQGFGPKKYRVRELEKARFRKRMRLVLYRNRSPLMRREGAAVRLVSCCTNPRKELSIYRHICGNLLPLRACFLQGCSGQLTLKQLGQRNSGDLPEAGTGWEPGIVNLNVHFFSSHERVLCFAQNGGEEGSFNSRLF